MNSGRTVGEIAEIEIRDDYGDPLQVLVDEHGYRNYFTLVIDDGTRVLTAYQAKQLVEFLAEFLTEDI